MFRLLRFLVTAAAAIVLTVFAVANREAINVDFWPLPSVVELPVYGVFLIGMFVGALMGGMVVWLGEHENRVAKRALQRKDLRREQQDAVKRRKEEAAAKEQARVRKERARASLETLPPEQRPAPVAAIASLRR